MKRKITQKDVAEEAGVSQALVSLVFSSATTDVSDSTYERVRDAATRLGYVHKKKNAGTLQVKRLAYIHPVVERGHHKEHWIYDSYDQFFDTIQYHLAEHAYKSGYSLVVRPYTNPTELTHWLMEWGMDGVLWHAHDANLASWIAERYPTVQINRHSLLDADAVSANREELVVRAMDHLRKKGHKRIVYISSQPIHDPLRLIQYRAYIDFSNEYGLTTYTDFMSMDKINMMETEKVFFQLFADKQKKPPTALITGDHQALHILTIAPEKGITVPDDLSIVGIDNVSASAFVRPALTTFDTRIEEIAKVAVALLIDRIKNPERAFEKVLITPTLVERESVAQIGNNTLKPDCSQNNVKLQRRS